MNTTERHERHDFADFYCLLNSGVVITFVKLFKMGAFA